MSKIRPLGNRILVERLASDEKSAGGIIIPGNAQAKSNQGIVRAAGPGAKVKGERVEMDVAEGDKILFGKYSGTEIEIEGNKLLLMTEEDVLAIVED